MTDHASAASGRPDATPLSMADLEQVRGGTTAPAVAPAAPRAVTPPKGFTGAPVDGQGI